MKIISTRIFEGRNIYSYKKCIRIDVDLTGYGEIPTKDIPNFNDKLIMMIPELNSHRCGIDEENGFCKRLKEGTYLAHVCEHIIIALQNKVGIDVSYGKSRVICGDINYIVFRYEYKKTAMQCAYLAVDIINSFIENKPIDFENRIISIKRTLCSEEIGVTTDELLKAASRKGLPYINLNNSGMYQIGYGRKGKIISSAIGNDTRCVGVDISCDKLLTKNMLYDNFIPVANGFLVESEEDLFQRAKELGFPVVLKPQFGNKGKGVFLNITNDNELLINFRKLKNYTNDILIEKYYKGNDYRVCVVNYKVVAVTNRVVPYVIGDGKNNLKELIYNANKSEERGYDHEKPMTKIKIDDNMIQYLNSQGLTLNSIPLKNEKIKLRQNANMSTGATAIDCTDEISEINKNICVRAAKSIGLDICGIDLCTSDISGDITKDGIVVEVNAAPGIRMHHFPSEGKKREVADDIISMMYHDNFNNIPVISVTGSNGKTTTVRLISYVLSRIGYTVGRTTTSGIAIGEEIIDRNDDTGASSAKCILLNKDVDVAVLETARGGIIKRGLGYDLADVAVLTNITGDHIGIDNIENIEELCNVKSLVLESVKENGYCVINADDKFSLDIINNIKANIIYFSKDDDNCYIKQNIKNNMIAVYVKKDSIYAHNRGKEYLICKIGDIPITIDGKLDYNVENVMASAAALIALNVDYCFIGKCLKQFNYKGTDNEGRFDISIINNRKIIVDYGHNVDGYRRVINAIKKIDHKRIIGVIGVPGDRSNDDMRDIGRLCSDNMDIIVIKEDLEKRGRNEGEVAYEIKKGVDMGYCKNVSIIMDEVEALKHAFENSDSGDIIIIFYESYDRISKCIKNL